MRGHRFSIFVMLLGLAMCAASCKREERSFHVPPAVADVGGTVPYQGSVRPGAFTGSIATTSPTVDVERRVQEPFGQQFANNAAAQADGQRLYEQFNCVGCHAHGGGGMGPPFLDQKWFYGSTPPDVYRSILQGRPNGMPSYRGRIPDYEIWELVAYVRSLSGHANTNAASGREDHLAAQAPPNSMPPASPEKVSEPTTGPAKRSLGP